MADTIKILGQTGSAANTEFTLYSVPSGKSAVVSSVMACNRGSTVSTFRLSASVAGAATTNKDYLFYDLPVGGNDTFTATVGISLATTDVLRIYSSNANMSFSAFGVEVS